VAVMVKHTLAYSALFMLFISGPLRVGTLTIVSPVAYYRVLSIL